MLDVGLGSVAGEEFLIGEILHLTDGEIDALNSPRGIKAAPLKELRESHHALARLLAKGLRPVEVSSITGFSLSRISILQSDPAFKELLAHYGEQVNSAFADIFAQLTCLSADALAEMRARLEDDPKAVSNTQLLAILQLALDRTGHGPTQKIESTSLSVTGEQILRIKSLMQESQNALQRAISPEGRAQGGVSLPAPKAALEGEREGD